MSVNENSVLNYDYAYRLRAEVIRRISCVEPGYFFVHAPKELYRYRSLSEYGVNDVIHSKMLLSHPFDMQDVFDGKLDLSQKSDEERKGIELLSKVLGISPTVYLEKIHERIAVQENFGREYLHVCCYSETNMESLMWDSYADAYRGFCVEYPFDCFSELLKCHLYKIVYCSDDMRQILGTDLEKELERGDLYLLASLYSQALLKKKSYEYEKEWRFVFDGIQYVPHVNVKLCKSPSAIYLGMHCDCEFLDEAKLKLLCKLLEFCRDNHVSVYKMEHVNTGVEIKFKLVEPSEYSSLVH